MPNRKIPGAMLRFWRKRILAGPGYDGRQLKQVRNFDNACVRRVRFHHRGCRRIVYYHRKRALGCALEQSATRNSGCRRRMKRGRAGLEVAALNRPGSTRAVIVDGNSLDVGGFGKLAQQEMVKQRIVQHHHSRPFQRAPVNGRMQSVVSQMVESDIASRRSDLHIAMAAQFGKQRA